MSIDDAFRTAMRVELRSVVREEIRAALAEAQPSSIEKGAYLSVAKAARFAEVHPDTIRAWIKAGQLRGHRAGRELRIRREDLDHFMAGEGFGPNRPTPDEVAATILSRSRK